MEENINPNPQHPEQAPMPAPQQVAPPAPVEAMPQAAAPVQQSMPPVIDPSAKKAEMMKRLMKVGGVSVGVIFLIIFGWAFLTSGAPLGPGFNRFLFILFNVLIGILTAGAFVMTLVTLFKSIKVKPDQLDLKKALSKKTLKMGVGFLAAAMIWLLGIALLQPRLIIEERFASPILTQPENTIGLSAPVEIFFDASALPIPLSQYQVLSYGWIFGDGSKGTGMQVSHRYTEKGQNDGRYTVILNVNYMDIKSGQQFEAQFTKDISIANERVSASFVASPEAGELPLKVTFDASSSKDPDGEIIAYEWDFDGDGRTDETGEVVTYEFTQEGEFEVTLIVTDNNGEVDQATKIIEAGSIGGLRANITTTVPQGSDYLVGEEYEFSGDDSEIRDGNISKYRWDFGDGTTITGRNVSHTYEKAGDYEITLKVWDAYANSDIATLEVEVVSEGAPPQAQIRTHPAASNGVVTGTVPFNVDFYADDSVDPDDDIIDYEWDFDGDGLADETGDKTEHTFTELGTHDVELTVIDSAGNEDSELITVEVKEQGIIGRLEISASNGEVPLTVQFDASGSTYNEGNIVSYEYDFGDGNTHVGGSSVTYKYTSVGTFTASMTVLGDDGSSDTVETQVVVRPVALTSCFTVNVASGSAPLFVTVDPACSQGTIKDYHWDFGNGTISFDRKPETEVYAEAGNYTISLEVTSDSGIIDTFEKTISVR